MMIIQQFTKDQFFYFLWRLVAEIEHNWSNGLPLFGYSPMCNLLFFSNFILTLDFLLLIALEVFSLTIALDSYFVILHTEVGLRSMFFTNDN